MFPHELARHYFQESKLDRVIELQWKVIAGELKRSGSLEDSLVLSDVSGSMSGTPMEVSVALGILISEITNEPFKHMVLTFHETPTFHVIDGPTLQEKVRKIKKMPWGGSTNFQACFDLILERAKSAKLKQSQMPKRLIVLSDMQFNSAAVGGAAQFQTNHQATIAKYNAAGYEVPQIVYWNLRGNTQDVPVDATSSNVVLLSGFSPSLLKQLMSGESVSGTEKTTPLSILKNILQQERYTAIQLNSQLPDISSISIEAPEEDTKGDEFDKEEEYFEKEQIKGSKPKRQSKK